LFVQKSVIPLLMALCEHDAMETKEKSNDILVLTGIAEGMKIRLTRLSLGLRNIDVACKANVQPIDVTRLELERYVRPSKKKRILAVLGISDDGSNEES